MRLGLPNGIVVVKSNRCRRIKLGFEIRSVMSVRFRFQQFRLKFDLISIKIDQNGSSSIIF